MNGPCSPAQMTIMRGDYGFEWLFTLKNYDGTPFDLSGVDEVKFRIQLQDTETVVEHDATAIAPETSGQVSYTVQQYDFPLAGRYNTEIRCVFSNIVVTFNNLVVIAQQDVPK